MGKTHALGAALAELQLDHDSRPFEALLVDLRECESSEWLRTKVFDSSQFVGWQNGRHDLRLFFDSLDEGRLHLRTLAALLAEKIRSLPSVVGLHLRIACRTADWPQDLEDALREKWGKDDLGVFELAPLDHDDIVSAGDASGLDGRAFYDEIDRRDVSPLAERPVALKFLLKSYLRAGHLPTGQKALYEEGCRLLCEEVSQSRLGARLTGELLPSQRLDVAMQIAAALVLGNRYAVWTGTGTAPQGDISLDELIATDISEERVNWNRSAILETLVDTALFSSRGPQRLGFSHQSYAEFLAAKWLKTGKLNERQISSILWSRVAGQEKLVPQLHQTAAWLAASDESIFAKVKKTDPEVLLSSDVSTATPQGRASLVDTLLEAFESDSIQESAWRLNRRYPKLKHDGLEEQLRKWILDSCKSPRSRRVALKIAQGCEIFKLTSDSLTIALDDEEDYQLRCDAAELVRELGDTPAKRRLKPLLTLEQGQDPDSELKAHALMACWPELMSAEELFSVITPPSNTSLGPYHRFLREDLVGKLKPEHLPAALRWFSEHAFWQHLDQRLTNVILDEAVKHLHNEEIREPFGDALFALLGSYDGFVRDEDYSWHVRICDDEALRRVAVGLLAVRIKKIGSSADLFFLFHSKLIQEKDFDWFVEQLEDRKESVTRRVYAHLMLWTYDQKSVSQIESILMAAQRYQEVAQAFADWLTPIDLQSEEAEKLRAQLQERKQREDRSRKSRAERSLSREVDKRIRDLVARVDRTGDVSIWWLLAWDLTLNDSMRYNKHIADLTSLPAWNRADATLRERLISIAQLYVEQSDAAPDKWFAESNIIHRPAYAGFKAMYLLSRERSDVFASLSPSVWKKWVPAILAAPNFSEQEEASIFLTERAYATVPEELTEWIVKEVRREGTAGNSLEVLSKIEKILDSKLDRALLEAAKATDLKVGAFCQLMELLLKRQVAGAQDFCESLLTLPLPIDGARRELIVSIGELLLRYGDGGADAIWLATLQDREFGRALFSKAAYNCYGGAGEVLRKWDEVRLGELFTWLSQEFPREKDERDREAGLLSAREAIATFRDQIISHLADRGSLAGRDVIRHLIDRFPEQEWFRWVLLRAEDNIRRSNWQPPTLEELFGLKRSQNRRFVGSEDELFEIVKESLGRLQEKLQGETELAEFLWNHPRRVNARPKEENELNNFVKNFLQDDLVDRGVLANREVEIRKGQMTDVLVQTITRVSRDIRRYAVVIETKGIWNNDIPVSIDKQLAGRYLLNNQTRHGILLVVWFSRDGWDQTDWRYRQGSRAQKDRVLSDLEEDAQHASKEFGVTIEPFVLDASLASQTKSST